MANHRLRGAAPPEQRGAVRPPIPPAAAVGEVEHLRVPLDDLIPNPENYNQHPPEQLRELKASLRRFGQVKDSVVRRAANGYMLIAGHGITTAARELVAENPLRFAHLREWNVVVVPPTWTDLDAKAYLVADNKTADKGVPDEEALARLLAEQHEAGTDLLALGSDEEELRDLLSGLEAERARAGDGAEEELGGSLVVDEQQTRVRPGDVWQLGRHRVACLDALDERAILARLLAGVTPSFVFSDPPYGIKAVSSDGRIGGGKHFTRIEGRYEALPMNRYAPIIGDETKETALRSFALWHARFPKAVQIWWGANHYCHGLPGSSCWLVWDKENGDTSFADAELAWCSAAAPVRIFRHQWNGFVRASERGVRRLHPTQKPIALFVWAAQTFGAPQDVVFDPFLGSGPSVIGAERLGDRTVYGCELSPAYVNVVIDRWEKETGQAACLLERTAPSTTTAAREEEPADDFR